ncbi:MAG: cyclopropane-fatty-acyl-phospholipid synthase family protein [Vulcanimicrobiota bacterium]
MDPKIYNENYFRTMRGESQYYEGKAEINPLYQKALRVIGRHFRQGTVLEFGCGRGEMLKFCLDEGAEKVVGVDFSPVAIELSAQLLAGYDQQRYELKEQDAAKFAYDQPVRLVLMMDFVEHVPDSTLDHVFSVCAQCLEPDGQILVHTFPTRGPNNIYHWLVRKGVVGGSLDLQYHVNVQSRASLRATLERAGLVVEKMWLETGYLTESNVLYNLNKKYPWLGQLVGVAERFLNLGPVRALVRALGLEEYIYMSIWSLVRTPRS